MSENPELTLTRKQRAYLEFLVDGGIEIKPASQQDQLDIPTNPPWKGDDEISELDESDRPGAIADTVRETVKHAMVRGDKAMFKVKQLEGGTQRAVFHGCRLVVNAVQEKLKEKMNYWKREGGSMSAVRIATTEAFMNEMAQDFQDLSKILDEEESKIQDKIEPLNP